MQRDKTSVAVFLYTLDMRLTQSLPIVKICLEREGGGEGWLGDR